MDKQIFFPSYQVFPGGHASGSLKELLAFGAGTKGAVDAFSPLTVYNAMYAGHHLTGRCCLSLSHLFISLCRKGEGKAFHYLRWLVDLGSGSQHGSCCTHPKIETWSSMLTFRASKTVLSDPARILARGNMILLTSLFSTLFVFLTSKTF